LGDGPRDRREPLWTWGEGTANKPMGDKCGCSMITDDEGSEPNGATEDQRMVRRKLQGTRGSKYGGVGWGSQGREKTWKAADKTFT